MWSRLAATLVVLAAGAAIEAQGGPPPLQAATIVERVGEPLPRALAFTDTGGRPVTLGALLDRGPVVISLAYFTCPMLCHLGQDGAADAFRATRARLGRDYTAVTVSIDPRDRPDVARTWQVRALARAGLPADHEPWRFLVGDAAQSRALAEALGFHYGFDPDSGQYSHAAALYVITADGRVGRYLYGITYAPAALDAALEAAAANRVGGPVDRFLLRCYHYVPALRRHAGFVAWLLRLGGLVVTLGIGAGLAVLWRRDVQRGAAAAEPRR